MKKLVNFFIPVLLCLVFIAMPVCADHESPYSNVVDSAELINNDEKLQERLESIGEKYDMDIVIVTVDSLGIKTATAFADDFYDYNDYSDDGILFLLSMEDRDWAISTKGRGIKIFTDSKQSDIFSAMKHDLANNDFDDAFDIFAQNCEEILINSKRTRYIMIFGIAVVVGLIAALITVFIMKGQLKSVRYERNAGHYLKNNSINLTQNYDIFLYKTLSKSKRESSSSSSGGGSSTHTSSSGSTHGGSSGKF